MNTSEKLRALFLAAIIIVSMVAVGAAGIGAASTQSSLDSSAQTVESVETGSLPGLDATDRAANQIVSTGQSTSLFSSQTAQVADQLKDASGETTVILLVDRNIQLDNPGAVSSEDLTQDSERTLQPVADSVNSLSNADVEQRLTIGNALTVEINLDEHSIDQLATFQVSKLSRLTL
jgi:hypothetical protein